MIKLETNDLAHLYSLGQELSDIAYKIGELDGLAERIATGELTTYVGIYTYDAQADARNKEKVKATQADADAIRQIIERGRGGLAPGGVVMLTADLAQVPAPADLEPVEYTYRDLASHALTLSVIRLTRDSLTTRRLEIIAELRAKGIYLDL